MLLLIKALLSGAIVAIVAEVSKRSPALGALVVSLPIISVLAVIWLWRDTGDGERIAAHMTSTFWYVLPSLPMFLLTPVLLRNGVPFWGSLAAGCALTVLLYLLMTWALARFGVSL